MWEPKTIPILNIHKLPHLSSLCLTLKRCILYSAKNVMIWNVEIEESDNVQCNVFLNNGAVRSLFCGSSFWSAFKVICASYSGYIGKATHTIPNQTQKHVPGPNFLESSKSLRCKIIPKYVEKLDLTQLF